MHFSKTFIVLAALVSTALCAAVENPAGSCPDGSVPTLVTTKIVDGAPLIHTVCNIPTIEKRSAAVGNTTESSLIKRGYDLCGAPCTTYCENGSGGPNPNGMLVLTMILVSDCETLANANAGDGQFSLTQGTFFQWNYKSCRVEFHADDQDVYYCWDSKNLAGVIDFVATHCQAKENANGGTCQFFGNTDIGMY
ncbi:hypothetical protein SISNIDRAFT_463210 [Sistotremastrum niveocremeum HHB9708]|uniref:Uncharacterized protein n=1 Tax=Sistotremastrum niveocremeum HHB9708 TaxID=1314777 RepID=A0A164YW12_9AGAM|nr:hypothetical protein SISNIDRAFT_463210 [Sistotremastrum niveocremeum HHB9708]